MDKNTAAFETAYWKFSIFKILISMEKIVRTSVQLMELILEKWPPASPL